MNRRFFYTLLGHPLFKAVYINILRLAFLLYLVKQGDLDFGNNYIANVYLITAIAGCAVRCAYAKFNEFSTLQGRTS